MEFVQTIRDFLACKELPLLSTVGKVFEQIVFKYAHNHLKDLCTLRLAVWFLLGRSTITQLTEVYHMFRG